MQRYRNSPLLFARTSFRLASLTFFLFASEEYSFFRNFCLDGYKVIGIDCMGIGYWMDIFVLMGNGHWLPIARIILETIYEKNHIMVMTKRCSTSVKWSIQLQRWHLMIGQTVGWKNHHTDNLEQVIQGSYMVSSTRCSALSDPLKKWEQVNFP